MAGLFAPYPATVRLLDPGAGIGGLTAAVVCSFEQSTSRPRRVEVVACEVDPLLAGYLRRVLESCRIFCEDLGIEFKFEIRIGDFIADSLKVLRPDLFSAGEDAFTHVIANPPYRKINGGSKDRFLLSQAGIETSNLYSAFVFLAGSRLESGGELVAITPRSFCNGSYFLPFRRFLAEEFAFRRCHVFDSRNEVFGGDEVLQENVIFAAARHGRRGVVLLSSSAHAGDEAITERPVAHAGFVNPTDPDLFFRLTTDRGGQAVADAFGGFRSSLEELGLNVSTGRVVDFRVRDLLRKEPVAGSVPLLYPAHLREGGIAWPIPGFKKSNAIVDSVESRPLLVPSGTYLLTKRFSAKEQPRRVVASLLTRESVPGEWTGIENHLNYFHSGGQPLEEDLAKGLFLFLNSTLLDRYFRQFNGSTQVNATDLRNIRYPDREALCRAGRRVGRAQGLSQDMIDQIAAEEFFMSAGGKHLEHIAGAEKIKEAIQALKELGLPREQLNERSALALLALLDLKPTDSWANANAPLRGITQMMTFFEEHYGKRYAPNTRETVRRFTMHQFIQAGIAVENPDQPGRPTNSPNWCYQIEPETLAALRAFGKRGWKGKLRALLVRLGALRERYERERAMLRIPVKLSRAEGITLSPGGQNVLIKEVVEQFCSRFTPGGRVVYVGDSAEKWGYFDRELLESLGVEIEAHGKMPDVAVHMVDKNWLVLVEAVTSHGPVNPKRHIELKELFEGCKAGLVFVSAFPDRKTLTRYIGEIAWETDVWCAETPTHLIHFNGERFLGPYN